MATASPASPGPALPGTAAALAPLAERSVPEVDAAQLLIDGAFVTGTGEAIEVGFPVTGERLTTLTSAGPEQIDAVMAHAHESFGRGTWRDLPASIRADVLDATADILAGQQAALIEQILFDNGKTRPEATIDVLAAVGSCRRAAQHAREDAPTVLPVARGVERHIVKEAAGVVVSITPFNAPLMFAGLKAAPALAAGNSVVLKPSERAPLLARAFCAAAVEAGVPPGVLGLVQGRGDVGAALCAHPQASMITITGGTRAGAAVMQAAAPTIKNVLLELGGKSAHIVLADADLDAAIPAVGAGIFRNAGQRCFSGSRLVVEEAVADRVEAGVVSIAESLCLGDPFDAATQVGPLIDGRAVDDAAAFVARSCEDGLDVACGGGPLTGLGGGSFFAPTVLLGARRDSYAAQEEVFGPVLTVIRVRDADEAVEVANDSRYGLAGGVWSRDMTQAMAVARAVRSGYMWVNTYAAVFEDVPFGGFGASGIGREAGQWGYDAYTELKSILIDTTGGSSSPVFA